jgi:protocatechuate 3,4-dioxygenase beta subunit
MYTACTQPDSLTFQQDELTEMIRTDGLEKVVQNYETSLAENPENDQAREMLKRLVTGSYGISHDESLRLRNIIRNYTRQATTVLVPPDEPGEPLIVSGTIRDTGGQPIAGALMYVFHADAKGYYTPDRPMDEPNARLFGYMKTAADGCYQFRTIRPGGYPQAPIPQHIHMTVTAPGYRDHKCRSTCQLVFEDDPRMTAEWQAWAEKGGNPVLSVTRDQDGVRKCVYDIVLERN